MADTGSTAFDFRPVRFSTRDLPERERVQIWREQFGRSLLRVDIEPVTDQAFRAEVTLRALPGFRMLESAGSCLRYQRTPALLADGDDGFGLVVNLGARATVSQWGKDVIMASGDALPIFSHKQASLVATRYVGMLFPRSAIASRVNDIDKVAARLVPRRNEALRLLKTYIRSLRPTLASASPKLRATVIDHLYDLVSLAFEPERSQSCLSAIAAARLSGALELIAQRFDEPDLSPGTVAREQNISPRYLQRLIEGTGRSFTARLNELRLQRAFALLTDPRNDTRRVIDIALQAGYSDISHFNRLFRARFGDTPTGVRGRA